MATETQKIMCATHRLYGRIEETEIEKENIQAHIENISKKVGDVIVLLQETSDGIELGEMDKDDAMEGIKAAIDILENEVGVEY